MSTLSKETQLCSLPDDSDVLGIQHHVDRDMVIVTLPRKISVFDVQQRKVVKNWTVKSFQQFICPVVYDQTTGHFVGALSHQVIQLWTQNDRFIDKSQTVSTNANKCILKIFSCFSREPLIVFKDATFSWLSQPEDFAGKEITSDSDLRVTWCNTLEMNDVVHLVLILNSEENKSALLIRIYQLEKDKKQSELREWQLTDNIETQEPLSYSILMKNSKLHVFTLWSGGSLLLSEMSHSEKISDIPHLSEPASIMSLDETQIAITGIISAEGSHGVGIWDTKFNILVTWQPFAESPKSVPKQLFCTMGHLYTVHERNLYMFSYSSVPSTLSAALGILSKKVPETSQNTAKGPEKLLSQLVDDQQLITQKEFSRTFQQFHAKCSKQPLIAWRNNTQLSLLVKRCANESRFWPHKELLQLVQSVYVANSICQPLVMAAIRHDDAVLLHACLTNLPDISESTLIHILQFCISVDDSKLSSQNFEDKLKVESLEDCPISDIKAAMLNTILAYPCNDIYLLECLKDLDFTDVLKMIRYLHYKLKASFAVEPADAKKKLSKKQRKRARSETKVAATTAISAPTLSQVIDWLSSLLDAHFTQLLLSTETRQYLLDLHHIVEDQVQFLDELGSLDGILSHLKTGGTNVTNPIIGQYCIQNLLLY